MATRSTNVESDESTMSQNAVVSCNRRLLAPAIAGTRLNIHLRSEDFVRIVLSQGCLWQTGTDAKNPGEEDSLGSSGSALAILLSKREMPIPLEAIIFDFDFTLADSSRGIVDCVGGALPGLGVSIPSREGGMGTLGFF